MYYKWRKNSKRRSYCQKRRYQRMGTNTREFMNFFWISRLISDVAANVLRRRLEETAQTLFLNDLENWWLKQVQEIKNTSYAAKLWGRFIKDISLGDETCRKSLKPLLMSWKCTANQIMTCSEEKSTLRKWRAAIQEHMRSGSSNNEKMCLPWLKEIKQRLVTIDIISESLNQKTHDLHKVCWTSRQTLLKLMKQHYDDFLSSSQVKFENWESLSKKRLVRAIKDLEEERKIRQKDWKRKSKEYFKSVEKELKLCLTSWTEPSVASTDILELKHLFDAFETEINTIDDTKLKTICDKWHEELSNLFDMWLEEIDTRHKKKRSLLKESPQKTLRRVQSIGSCHVMDFFASVCGNETLTKQLSKQQLSILDSWDGISNLKKCDTALLYIVFRNCLVYPTMQGWNENPDEWDLSFGADITRLMFFGKDIIAHIKELRINTCTFKKLWTDITEVLFRLASQSGDDFKFEVSNQVDNIRQRSNFIKRADRCLSRILRICKSSTLAELNDMVEPSKYKELMRLIKRIEKVERGVIKESYHSGSDEESYSSSRDSESYHSGSDEESYSSSRDSESYHSGSDEESYSSNSDSESCSSKSDSWSSDSNSD